MPPDPPREQGPPGLATPTQINATPTSKTVENPDIVTEYKTCSSKLNPLQMLATALQLVAEQINETLLLVRQKMMGMLLNVVHCQVQKIV